MIPILISIIAAIVASVVLLRYSGDGYDGRHSAAAVFGVFLGVGAGIAAISYAFAGWIWIAADAKARIINREYSTNYTREEIFFASDVIETIREIDRKRIEINGDLMRDSEK